MMGRGEKGKNEKREEGTPEHIPDHFSLGHLSSSFSVLPAVAGLFQPEPVYRLDTLFRAEKRTAQLSAHPQWHYFRAQVIMQAAMSCNGLQWLETAADCKFREDVARLIYLYLS